MTRQLIPWKGIGLIALLAGLVCEASAALSFFVPGVTWLGGVGAVVLHIGASLLTGFGAASFLDHQARRGPIPGPALLFTLLTFTIPIAGLVAVLVLTTILGTRWRGIPPRSALECIPEPGPDTSRLIPQPLVTTLTELDPASLRACVLGMEDMPSGQTRPLLARLQKHPDVRVQLYAAGLINDQTEADERCLAALEDHGRSHPLNLPTLLAIVESHLRLIDERLVPSDELAHTAQRAVHATEALLAVDPHNAVALRSMTRFQLVLGDFHSAYGTILRLHQLADHRDLATDLLARLSYEYAANQPPDTAPPSSPPKPKVQKRFP